MNHIVLNTRYVFLSHMSTSLKYDLLNYTRLNVHYDLLNHIVSNTKYVLLSHIHYNVEYNLLNHLMCHMIYQIILSLFYEIWLMKSYSYPWFESYHSYIIWLYMDYHASFSYSISLILIDLSRNNILCNLSSILDTITIPTYQDLLS